MRSLFAIAQEMENMGVPVQSIIPVLYGATKRKEIEDIFALWDQEEDRDVVLEKLGLQAEKKHVGKEPKSFVKHNVKWKRALRKRVNKYGGISKVAELSGIPQPSLSRILNTVSTPRASTLHKLAEVLECSIEDLYEL